MSGIPLSSENYPQMLRGAKPVSLEDAEQERQQRKRDTALGYRIFGAHRWGQTGDGHISARDPERTDCFWLLRYGVPFNEATVDDLVLVGPDGSVVEGEGEINESAYCIHMPIHDARPEVVAVAHTHTGYGTPWCAKVEPFRAVSQEAVTFVFNQSIFDGEDVMVMNYGVGTGIAAAMGSTSLCMLRNHGLLTAGHTVGEAIGLFVMAERVAEVHVKIPDATSISNEAAKELSGWAEDPSIGWSSFEWLCRSLIPDPSVVA